MTERPDHPLARPPAVAVRSVAPGGGFTIIELLVSLGIIAVLIALLMPALSISRRQARSLSCQANLRAIGQALYVYQVENDGWIFPAVVNPATGDVRAEALGINVAPHLRWPMRVFKMPAAPFPPPYDSAAYDQEPYDPVTFPAEPYTPPVLRCPADVGPYDAHSYVLNGHVAERRVRGGSAALGGVGASGVILAGEKVTHERDYYLQSRDFARIVEPHRHGRQLRSNYLYLDGHVDNATPQAAKAAIDPWEVQE